MRVDRDLFDPAFGKRLEPDRPEDATGVVEPSADLPKLDWNAPVFDPANPAGFDAFLAKHRALILQ